MPHSELGGHVQLDGKRPTRAVEELHQVAATRTERRQTVKVDCFRVADLTFKQIIPNIVSRVPQLRKPLTVRQF
jgi:hypothetical protein